MSRYCGWSSTRMSKWSRTRWHRLQYRTCRFALAFTKVIFSSLASSPQPWQRYSRLCSSVDCSLGKARHLRSDILVAPLVCELVGAGVGLGDRIVVNIIGLRSVSDQSDTTTGTLDAMGCVGGSLRQGYSPGFPHSGHSQLKPGR